MKKELVVVGGPNGAGKTTFVNSFLLDDGFTYLGADLIAYELCPEDVESVSVRAGREFIKRIKLCREAGENVIVESTLSGRSLAKHIERYKAAGYEVQVIFISLPNDLVSADRVKIRVTKGGHNVPDEDIKRRFLKTHRNFWHLYRFMADEWFVFVNKENGHELLAAGVNDCYFATDESLMASFLWKTKA